MLKYVMGGPATGKTKLCLDKIIELENNFDGNILYLVPEQASLQAERNLVKKNGAIIKTQVLSFNRLCFYIFNEVGNEKKILLEDIGKNMLLKKILFDKDIKLNFFGGIKKKLGFIDNLGDLISEFYKNDIHDDKLCECLSEISENLKIKLEDLIVIYKKYNEYIEKKYLSSDNILDILAQKIFESQYLNKIKVFIDGFDGFSEQEYKVINELMRAASEIYLTVGINFNEGHKVKYKNIKAHDLFFEVKNMVNKISDLAEKNNLEIGEIVSLKKIYGKSNELEFLTKNFFGEEKFLDDVKDICLYELEDFYEEIELVARKIIFYVKHGFRFKDIVVIAENLEEYAMFIERIFLLYKIPFFIDKKIGIMNNELVNFIRAIFDLTIFNFNYESVFGFLKNSLCGLDLDDMDLLENYVLEFGIKNNMWDTEWNLGFKKKYDEQKIKQIKNLVCEKFNFIKKNLAINKKYEAKELCKLVFKMLDFFDVKKKLFESDKREMNLKIWNKICIVFEKIYDVFGSEKLDIKKFKEIMDEGLKKIDLGLIPEFIDVVMIGNIKRTRINETKILFIVGANDGFLNKNINENEIINDDEKIFLNGFGLNFFEPSENIILKNNFLLYEMVCKAKEKINISCCLKDKNDKFICRDEIFEKIKSLFVSIKINCDKDELKNSLWLGNSFDKAIKIVLNEKREKQELDFYNLLKNSDEYKSKIYRLEELVFKNNFEDKEDKVERKKILNVSVSQLEKFSRCPFSYFLKYDLKLNERKIYELKAIDLGVFLHGILKEFFLFVKENNLIFDCEKNLEEYINIAIERSDFNKNIFFESAYYKFVLFNLKNILYKSIRAMLKNIYKEKYMPDEFEFEFKNIKFDKDVFLNGRVDRIDILNLNSERYLRVIDYKSSKRSVGPKNIADGLELQLLMYLKVLCDQKKIKPGGAYYFCLNDPIIEIKNKINDSELDKKIETEFEMQKPGSGEINSLIDIAYEKSKSICHEIKDGKTSIEPHDKNSCLYCEYYSICRKKD